MRAIQSAVMEQPPLSVTEVFRSTRKRCAEYALVLEAVGIPHRIVALSGEWAVVVQNADVERARAEIAAYHQENRGGVFVADAAHPLAAAWTGVFCFVSLLLLVAVLLQWFDGRWFEAGRTQAALIRRGEWWRTVTALTLHTDVGHLFGNCAIGGLFGLFAGQMFGPGVAWLSILLSGAAGNLLNAWLRPSQHTSVGASTAVFGALGLMAAHAWLIRSPARSSALARYAPIISAVVLLSFLGTGGVRTDVFAHVAGLAMGLVVGVLLATFGRHLPGGRGIQAACGLACVLLVMAAWLLALTRAAAAT